MHSILSHAEGGEGTALAGEGIGPRRAEEEEEPSKEGTVVVGTQPVRWPLKDQPLARLEPERPGRAGWALRGQLPQPQRQQPEHQQMSQEGRRKEVALLTSLAGRESRLVTTQKQKRKGPGRAIRVTRTECYGWSVTRDHWQYLSRVSRLRK